MIIGVVGLWHLGTVTAACMSSAGFDVIAYDDDRKRITQLKDGKLPVYEPGLEEMVAASVQNARLRFSDNPKDLASTELVWITYDTPVDDDDKPDPGYVFTRIMDVIPSLKDSTLVLISSQLPVGSIKHLEDECRSKFPLKGISFAYSPENLRLGKAIDVFLKPDRIVVGVRTTSDKEKLKDILGMITDSIEWMNVESAEMTKHAINTYLATSVAFINELASLCREYGAIPTEVERGLKTDSRIGVRAYLHPGVPYAGGTLARDINFLVDIGKQSSLPTFLLDGVKRSNDAHKLWARTVLGKTYSNLKERRVAILGLTYKPNTDTLRRSSAIENALWLHNEGAVVSAFEPSIKRLPDEYSQKIILAGSIEEALTNADAVLVSTEWPMFRELTPDTLLKNMRTPLVLDMGAFLKNTIGRDPRIQYLSVGE